MRGRHSEETIVKNISIGKRTVGKFFPTYFVADIAANHDGDLGRAKELIHMAAEAGADAAKFQNFKAAKIVSDYGFKSLGVPSSHQEKWKKSVFEVYNDASIPDDWTGILYEECQRSGIDYSTSPYDLTSVEHAAPYVSFFKIGSGDITWPEICLSMAAKGKPVFLATGASDMHEVDHIVTAMLAVNSDLVLMQCNTNYTGSAENFRCVNLRVLETYAQRWPELVLGFSDHTPGHSAVLGAVALGARVIEKHFTDDSSRNGPDHSFSLTPETWREMVGCTRELEAALGDGIKRVEENESETVILQRRCLRAVHYLPAGHVLSESDLEALRPAPIDAVSPADGHMVYGKTLIQPLDAGQYIALSHVRN